MNEVDEIKERINIADLIGGYLTMQKAGSNFKARCPFHQEKTASFMISPEKQIYKCFGCGEGGDIFEFVMKMEGLNFPEALQLLADRAGVIIKKSTKTKEQYKKEKDTKTLLFKINKISTKIFEKVLKDSKQAKDARDYLKKRKLTKEIIDKFQIGYAPRAKIIKKYFNSKKIGDGMLRMAGNPDRFYDRIIFPIFDILGEPIAFTGRTLSDEVQPKYLNTAETALFKKGKTVYGLNFAKAEIKKKKYSIVVEGQMDVILSHMAGVENTVATSGTAVTVDILRVLSRFADNIAFCFDNDDAGFEAAKKAIKIAYESEVNPYIISIDKKFKDVGEVVEDDPEIWKKTSGEKVPAMEWLINRLFDDLTENSSAVEKKKTAKEIMTFIILISDPIEANHYKKILASKLSVSERIINEAIDKIKLKINKKENKQINNKTHKLEIEELMIGLLFYDQSLFKVFINSVSRDDLSEYAKLQQIYKSAKYCYDKHENKSKEALACIKESLEEDLSKEVKYLSLETSQRVEKFDPSEIKSEMLDYISKIKSNKNKKIKTDYAKMIKDAEGKKDIKKLKKLLIDFQKEISNS